MSTASPSATVAAPRRAVHRASPLTVGTIVFLASECMFFGALFASYFTMRAITTGPWPPEGAELPQTIRALSFTLILVASSFTMQMAVRTIAKGDKTAFRRWVVATAVLGAAFVINQGLEWEELIDTQHAHGFSAASHAFGSAFFTMTGFHGAHVTGGLLAMMVLLGRSGSARFGKSDLPTVEVVSYYWHFVDVVWVIMFTILFFVR